MIDIEKIRSDFKILSQKVHGNPLIYFDSAATTQKPESVINALSDYYRTLNSNIHRGVHFLSVEATVAFEQSRTTVQQFINAKHSHEIIFTRGTTESINLVAASFGKQFLTNDSEVIISAMEHHSNIVPWQMICEERGAKLKVIPMSDKGEIGLNDFAKLLNKNTKLVSITHISNALGTINPIKEVIKMAHDAGVPILIDGAQAVSHTKVDVQDLDCDFYCFSGHKMYAPMGVGVLYGKEAILNEMPPYQGGGEMIKEVHFEKTTYNDLPFKFEAGTPSVGDTIGLMKAIEYMQAIGIDKIAKYENGLLNYCIEKLKEIPEIRFIGTAEKRAGLVSFLLEGAHPYDVGTLLDQMGIAVRTGHHCAQPAMERFGIPGTIRASFGIYNTKEEVNTFINALLKVKKMLL